MRLKSICMSSVLLQYYQPTYLYIVYYLGRFYVRSEVIHKSSLIIGLVSQYYMGRFYVRSEVRHKSPPDYCVGKSVLHGKILRKNFDLT